MLIDKADFVESRVSLPKDYELSTVTNIQASLGDPFNVATSYLMLGQKGNISGDRYTGCKAYQG